MVDMVVIQFASIVTHFPSCCSVLLLSLSVASVTVLIVELPLAVQLQLAPCS